ncbi:double-strand break repair protein AddB [Bosea sp. (in: a-proteobacteria)]|uniref:double-strand break repair protein AddB n=1 Tax=Bosea sp. (in: a-proteobacteria) TaxID=1871050 RepID=UPI0027325BD2|nr:double-strand break repair protein AddB [Bosea sp. (in: a-proteobacteria)]MDP3407529.1 double-strand break repair protein AddB [Bosea sp. (in: a-proteobacteria)]
MPDLNLFTIPAGAPFLDVLAQAMLAGRFGAVHDPDDPAAIARTTLYLPTRRAARAFAACLSDKLDGRPLLLPRIMPLGDVDEAETALIGTGAFAADQTVPIEPLARRMILTRLVDAWGRSANRSHLRLDPSEPSLVPATLAEAYGLAGDLAALLDQLQTEGVPVERLKALDAARFDKIWQLNASFLAILGEAWPAILNERGACDPADFRNRMLAAERERLLSGAVTGPIIAAGSTGTVPATARLLAAIARLANGAVVLPGLDLDLPDAAWDAITAEPAPSHPQAALHHLLETLQVTREDVASLAEPDQPRAARSHLLREALLPASVTQSWADLRERLPAEEAGLGLRDLRLVEAADERQEALTVAIALRETLEEHGAQAALITPDRGLAERVTVELRRWNIAVDDSAGLPLARWPAGSLLRLVLEAALAPMTPAALVPLLAHPLCRLGLSREDVTRGASALEIGLWRGEAVGRGLAGLHEQLGRWNELLGARHAPGPRRRLSEADGAAASQVLAALGTALSPLLEALFLQEPSLSGVTQAARAAVEALSRDEDDRAWAFAGPDGEALAGLFDDLGAAQAEMPMGGRPADFVAILDGLLAEQVVRRSGGGHPRVKIWGLLEARLLEADHIVLGGLNEAVWPPQTKTDSFINRPMRTELGLSPPERRVGQTAHDFIMALGARRVTLTRARKAGESETIASRFWQRLKAVTPEPVWTRAIEEGQRLTALASVLSAPADVRPVQRPAPKPPRALQPLSLSVTDVETLYRDPYQIHARRILKLDALPALIEDPTAQDRGTLLHDIVADFALAYPEQLPADALGRLIAIGERKFQQFADAPEVRAFWWPRFLITAGHFIGWEGERRGLIARVGVELATGAEFALADGARFRLSGRADRIELTREPALRIIDFKTGAPPSKAQVEKGFAPQLTLEAELAARAGFPPLAGPTAVEALLYLKLHHDPKGWARDKPLTFDGESLADVAARHLERLLAHLDALRSGREAFVSRRAPDYIKFASPYDHLARVKEWAAASDSDEGGEA